MTWVIGRYLRRLLLPAVGLSIALAGCGSVRGELVETGFAIEEGESVPVFNFEPPANYVEVRADEATSAPFMFTATDFFTGAEIDGLDLYDQRPLMMMFTVPSCPVCQVEGPDLALAAERHDEITFVVVNSADEDEAHAEWIESSELTGDNIIHIVDEDLSLWRRFRVQAQPSYILVDNDGRIRSSMGALEHSGLDRAAALVLT